MANTLAWMKRIELSHKTDHQLCSVRDCSVAKLMAEDIVLPDGTDDKTAPWLQKLIDSVSLKMEFLTHTAPGPR